MIVQHFPVTMTREAMASRVCVWELSVPVGILGLSMRCLRSEPSDQTNGRYVVFQWAKDYGPEPRTLPTPPDTPFVWAWCARSAGNNARRLLQEVAALVREEP